MKFQDGDRLLFIGDSITDCGRARPVGELDGLGEGYVAFVESLLAAWYPQSGIRVFNMGVGGDRVTELYERWRTDVLDLEPDWLSVMIGINDVWRQFDRPFDPSQVTIDRYEKTYRTLLKRTSRRLKGLILMTPYYLEPNRSDPMRRQMDEYGQVVEQLAADYDAVLVDVQSAFDGYLAHRPAQSLCGDRVHVNSTGHMIIARAFLTAVGFDWSLAQERDD